LINRLSRNYKPKNRVSPISQSLASNLKRASDKIWLKPTRPRRSSFQIVRLHTRLNIKRHYLRILLLFLRTSPKFRFLRKISAKTKRR
jgi:hypothetical protein